jgi:uncharacterized membrane protein required for colicin V production
MAAFMLLMIMAGLHNGLIRCIVGTVAYILSAAVSLVITLIFSGIVDGGRLSNIICYLIAFVVVYAALIVAGVSLNLLTTLPVLSSVNRIGGALIGGVIGFLMILLFLAAVSIIADTGNAKQLVEMIDNSEILKSLYDNNIVLVQLERFV